MCMTLSPDRQPVGLKFPPPLSVARLLQLDISGCWTVPPLALVLAGSFDVTSRTDTIPLGMIYETAQRLTTSRQLWWCVPFTGGHSSRNCLVRRVSLVTMLNSSHRHYPHEHLRFKVSHIWRPRWTHRTDTIPWAFEFRGQYPFSYETHLPIGFISDPLKYPDKNSRHRHIAIGTSPEEGELWNFSSRLSWCSLVAGLRA